MVITDHWLVTNYILSMIKLISKKSVMLFIQSPFNLFTEWLGIHVNRFTEEFIPFTKRTVTQSIIILAGTHLIEDVEFIGKFFAVSKKFLYI